MRQSTLLLLVFAMCSVGCAKQVQVKKYRPPVKIVPAPGPVVKKAPKTKKPKAVVVQHTPVAPTLPKRLETVYFAFNKYSLTPASKQRLMAHLGWLQKHKNVQIKIAGHCDQRGSVEYNLLLGERRARAIKRFLTTMGIPESRLSIISYGHQKLAASGSSADAHAKNRRGEFRIIPQ